MIETRAERRQLERAKEKYVAKLMKGGYDKWIDITEQANEIAAKKGFSENPYQVWRNGMFVVQAFKTPNEWGAIRLMIRWLDARPDHDWALFQRIKNDLFGPNRIALEVYPDEYHKQDVANMYWLWVLPEGFECPIQIKRK